MKKVLIIEDNAVIQQILVSWFQDDDFEVHSLPDTKGLDDVIRQFKPDLILTDIMLPGMSGPSMIETFAGIRIPKIVISSMDEEDVHFFAERIGAIGCFCKPIDLTELFEFIHDHFSEHTHLISLT